jgi:hypothetical protein
MSSRKRAPRGARVFGYAIAIVVNIVAWFIFHNLGRWNLPYIIVEEFSRVLPALDLSLWASTVGNALFMAYDPRWLKSIGQAVLNALAVNAMYAMWRVFPFDLPGNLGPWARRALILLMVVVAIATFAELLQLLIPGRRGED